MKLFHTGNMTRKCRKIAKKKPQKKNRYNSSILLSFFEEFLEALMFAIVMGANRQIYYKLIV